ncbi:hypothetical protein M0812_07848 [Anaeramoeba flamelloides]|uniref:Uncharacterized protein n=1 Tax=Anaeramoeba flamelloides TaxID=1746091 RepID=A0AAV8A2R6_9EUKA|nr:hypothetical protein M0812_07848 [Anaeramoeba flamelloides]
MGESTCFVICVLVFFLALLTGSSIWTGVERSYRNKFYQIGCKVIHKSYQTEQYTKSDGSCDGKETTNYQSQVNVEYFYDKKDYQNITLCNFGSVCLVSKGSDCEVEKCDPDSRTHTECRKQIDPSLSDFYDKYKLSQVYDCLVNKDNPDQIAMEIPTHNLKWTLFLWIPCGIFFLCLVIGGPLMCALEGFSM